MKKDFFLFYIPLSYLIIVSLIAMVFISDWSDIYRFCFIKELSFIIAGIPLMIIISKIKIKRLLKLSPYLYYFSLLLLILVLLVGNITNGSKAWFNFGFFKLQPSELMKLSLILYLNRIVNKNDIIYLIRLIVLTLIPSILVFLEPDTGAIIIYFLILLSVIYPKKIKKKYKIILSIFLISSFLITTYLIIYNPGNINHVLGTYRLNRIVNLKSGYQIDNALTSIGSAKLLSFNNKPTVYIPEAQTDFIFAYITGLLGIIPALLIIGSYYLICLFILFKKHLISYSLLSIFLFQVIYNLGFNIGILPIMGIPLPFLSYGGSNIIIYFIIFGILLNKGGNSNYNRKNNRGKNKALARN